MSIPKSRTSFNLSVASENLDRHAQRCVFLGKESSTLVPLPGDASNRRYFRYGKGLLMDAPPPEDPAQFARVAQYLVDLGLSAPRPFHHNFSLGFLALEDFGEATYTRLLQAGKDPYFLYELAVDKLIALHQRAIACPPFIEPYAIEALVQEATLFVEWYLPTISNKPLPQGDKEDYQNLWAAVFQKALEVPHSLVLRDYHVDNLMYLPDRPGISACGLLDFQDALWGPVVYDLVSLLEDARLDLDPLLVEHCWQRYFAAFPSLDEQKLRKSGCILSAGRHAKIIGIFTRLAVRDGKPRYLAHLPRIWRLLQACLNHPDLAELKAWFEHYSIAPKGKR